MEEDATAQWLEARTLTVEYVDTVTNGLNAT